MSELQTSEQIIDKMKSDLETYTNDQTARRTKYQDILSRVEAGEAVQTSEETLSNIITGLCKGRRKPLMLYLSNYARLNHHDVELLNDLGLNMTMWQKRKGEVEEINQGLLDVVKIFNENITLVKTIKQKLFGAKS